MKATQAAAPRNVATSDRIEVQHGLYRIIAGSRGPSCQAIAYIGSKQRYSVIGKSVETVVEQARAIIDKETSNLREVRIDGVPSASEFRDALKSLDSAFSERQRLLLRTHRWRPGGIALLSDLAEPPDITAAMVEAEYVRLGRRVGRLLKFAPAAKWVDRSYAAILVLATAEDPELDRRSPLRLRSELVEALSTL